MTVNVIPVTDESGAVTNADMLVAAEGVHRQLRPHLPPDYVARMNEVFASGAEMAVAIEGSEVAGLAVFRILEKTFTGRELYCDVLALDSGTQRQQAHKFYFREGMPITSFHFTKKL